VIKSLDYELIHHVFLFNKTFIADRLRILCFSFLLFGRAADMMLLKKLLVKLRR